MTNSLFHQVIIVPPFTSVTVCSSLEIKDNVEVPYTSRGIYSTGGMSAENLYKMLKEEGIDVWINWEGLVETKIKGVFKGNIVFNSSFIVVDGIRNSCT